MCFQLPTLVLLLISRTKAFLCMPLCSDLFVCVCWVSLIERQNGSLLHGQEELVQRCTLYRVRWEYKQINPTRTQSVHFNNVCTLQNVCGTPCHDWAIDAGIKHTLNWFLGNGDEMEQMPLLEITISPLIEQPLGASYSSFAFPLLYKTYTYYTILCCVCDLYINLR